MADTTATAGARRDPQRDPQGATEGALGAGLERLAGFRVTYLAIFAFMGLYILSVEGVERWLGGEFRERVAAATEVSPVAGPIAVQIQNRVSERVLGSPWVRYGGVRVNVTVLGADGLTPLYVGGGKIAAPPADVSLEAAMQEALRLLPAIADVFVSVPNGSPLSVGIFGVYAAVLLQGLFLYNRHLTRRQRALIEAAVAARDLSADRARSIEEELAKVRDRLREVEPTERSQAQEIRGLERERHELRAKLRELTEREVALRGSASRADELEQERQALEELLEEALEDVSQKEGAIASLQDQLRNAGRQEGGGRARTREAERVAKRLRTLYKNLDVDDRAVADVVALGDESLRLRAEEALKRLDEDPDTAAIRRKVGGLPPQLSIFELGFAGKGRIYYARRERSGFRVLAIGGKATQKQDLEYLSRL